MENVSKLSKSCLSIETLTEHEKNRLLVISILKRKEVKRVIREIEKLTHAEQIVIGYYATHKKFTA
jgi:hypothetical protein